MKLVEWLAKYDTKLQTEINPMNNCAYHFVHCSRTNTPLIELYNLEDYHVSAACGMVIYLIPRQPEQDMK
jgi:hypothetical protein